MSILRDAIKKNREEQELRAKSQTDSILKKAIQMNRAGEKVEPVQSTAAQKTELPGLSLPTLETAETPLASNTAKEKAVLDMAANGTGTKFQGTVFEQTAAKEAGKSALERQNVRGMADQLRDVQTRYATDEQIDNRLSSAREAVEDLQLQKQYAEAVGDLEKAAGIEARRKTIADRVGELASEKQTRADNAYYRDLENRQTGLEAARNAEDYLSAAGGASYQNIPRGGEYENLRRAVMSITTGKLADSKAQQMTEDEKNTLLYYVGKGQVDKAKEYLETLDRALNERKNKDAAENAAQWAKEHPAAAVLGSAVTWPANIPAYLENVGNTVQQAVTGKYEPADVNSNIYLGARMNAGLQQGVSTAAKEWGTSTFGNETAGDVAGFLAGLLPSVAQNLSQAFTLGPAALPAMAMSEAGSTTTEALERGATTDQAFWLGTIGGATEYITEKLPLENLLSVLGREGKVGLKRIILDVLQQGGTEFAEEAISEIAGNVADAIIMGQNSQFQQTVREYMAQGMDETEARSKALVQYYGTNVLQAGLGGFLSGGMMMGATNAVNQGMYQAGQFADTLNELERAYAQEGVTEAERKATAQEQAPVQQVQKTPVQAPVQPEGVAENATTETAQDERVQEVSAEDTVRGVIDAALESGNGKTTTAAVSAALNNLGGNTDALTSAFRAVMNEREYVFDRDGNIVKRSPYDVHIDERTGEDLSSRRVHAFQFDHPELHQYFAEAAKAMQYDISGTVPGERFPTYGTDGYMVKYTGTTRYTTEPVATVKDDYGLSYGDIDRALQNIIEDNGQENYAAAKKVEMVLDDMLTNGYTDIDGNQIPANEEYVAAKERVLPESERNARSAQAAQAHQEESEGLPLFSGTEIRDGYAETLKGAQADGRAEGDQGTVAAQPGGDGAAESGAGIGNPPYGGDGGWGTPVDTAKQDGRMGAPEGTGSRARNQQAVVARSRQDAVNAQRISKNRSVRLGVKEVRPVDLGIKQVSENAYITEMSAELVEQDQELRTIREENRKDGYETHFYIGRATLKSGSGSIEGWVSESKMEIWVQADSTNPESTATKINLHERAHPILDEPGVSSYVARRLIENYGEAKLREMVASYLERYRGVYNEKDAGMVDETTGFTAEEMESLKEFLADSLAGRNRFGARAGDLQQEVAAYMDERGVNAKSSAVAAAMDRRTGPPAGRTDIRFSEEETQEGGNSLLIDNETNRGYDGRTNTEQEGNYGREEEAAAGKGIPGNVLREEAQRPAYSDEGGAGGVRTEAARDWRVGEIAPWADGRLTEPKTKAAGEALEAAREYGARAYTVEDAAIKERRDTALALTQNGVIYLSDSIPDGMGEVIGNHELVHAEKQNGNEAYLDFLDGTFQRLDHQTQGAADLVDLLADMRVPGSSFMDLDEKQGETVLDELNALVWGYYKADPENAREQFSTVFLDYDSYIRDLEAAVTRNAGTTLAEDDGEQFGDNNDVRFSIEVTDPDTLDFLDDQDTITTYKTMQLVDGKLYPPMAARVDGDYEDASTLGKWEQATEHPELIRNGNKYKLDKGKGQGSIEAAYNPYMHSSNLVLNDQFTGAYTRDNLVTVECEVPVSEATSGYRAKYAKDTTGWHPWHTGTVASELKKRTGTERQVFLSRWIKPVRIVPDTEVAQMYKEMLNGTDIAVPDNVVTPSLLDELEKAGVNISESGRVKRESEPRGLKLMDGKENVRFSMEEPVEETEDLLALHNLTEKNLMDSLDLGGLPMPSIAVVKSEMGHSAYGPISLVFGKDTIDPEFIRSNKLYSGDAWTPTVPSIEHKANWNVIKAIRDKVYELVGGYETAGQIQHIGLDTDNVEDMLDRNGGDMVEALKRNDTMKYAFLREMDPSYWAPTKRQSLGRRSSFDDSIIQEVAERYGETGLEEMVTGGYRYLDEHPEIESELLGTINDYYARKLEQNSGKKLTKPLVDKLGFAKFDNITRDAYRYVTEGAKSEVDVQALRKDLGERVDQGEFERWLGNLFDGVVEKRGIRNNRDTFTLSGTRRGFDALHYEVNLENIVKAMRASEQKGGGGFMGATGIWGVSTKDYSSIDEMKADRGRLQSIQDEEYAEMREGYTKRLAEIAESISDPMERNRFIAADRAAEAIVDTLRTKKTAAAIDKELRTYRNLNIGENTAQDIVDLVRDIQNMPTEYFEAKPRRAVGFDEVLAAVIPSDSSERLRNALEEKGVNVLTYENGNETDRLEKINSIDNVRFSMEEDETPAAYQFRRVNTLEEERATGREKGEDDLYRPEGMSDQQYDFLNRRWKEQQSQRTAQADPEARAAVEQEKYMQDLSKENFTGTEAMQKLGVKIEGSVGIYDAIKSMIANDRAAKSVRKETRKAERRLHATEAERNFAAGISAGIYTAEDIPASMDRDKVEELADYYWAERAVSSDMIAQQRTDINRRLSNKMGELFKDSENFKVSGMMVLNERTPERNMLHIFGDERGAAINKAIFDPVSVNEAERFRFQNRMLDKVRTFEDSSGKQSRLTKEERALVQQVIEGRAVQEMVAGMEMSGAIESAAENIRNGKDAGDQAQEFGLNNEEKRLAVKYARWLETQEALKSGTVDNTRVENAVKTYSELFNQFYDAINDFLVAHGYEPIGFIKGYAPHLQPEQNFDLLNAALESMGINTEVTNLPASIAGLTAYYKPNKRWNPYFLTRTSDVTKYDIVEAFQSYVDYMSDVLYHTDDIMRVRQAANYFRRTYATEETRNNLEWAEGLRDGTVEEKANYLRDHDLISKNTVMTPEDINAAMDKHISELYENIKNTTKYGNLVMWLDNYANILAGKQSMADRGDEYKGGRKLLNVARKLVDGFGITQVAGNLSSALNQTAQIPQIFGELGVKRTAQAIADMMSGKTRRAGWAQESDFLMGKEGVNYIVTDTKEMVIGALFKPAEFMDGVTSTLAVRGKYLQEIAAGKTEKEAMKAADAFGKAVMGSRMKGSRPLGFESKGVISKALHIFQVEAINSWEHISQDLPRDFRNIAKEQGKGAAARALAGVIVKTLLAAFLLNRVAEEAYGGTPAPFDLLGLSANFIASGEGLTTNKWLKTVLDNGWEKLTGERLFDTEADALGGDFDWSAAMEDTAYNISNDVPYLRNAAGLLGLGDNTLPIPDLIGAGKDIYKAAKDDGLLSAETGKAALGFAEELLPGGRQLKKTTTGLETVLRGGKYKGYGDEARLQYPVENDFWSTVQALMFGNNALSENREFYASGASGLTANQTQLYQSLVDGGVSREDAYDAIQEYRAINNDKSLTSYERGQSQRDMIRGLDMTDEQKLEMYRGMTNADSRAEQFQMLMDAGMDWDQVMDAYDKYAELSADEDLKAAERATELAKWVDQQGYTAGQREAVKEQLRYWQNIPAEASSYEKFAGAGLDPETAYDIQDTLRDLEPEDGKQSVSNGQKIMAIAEMPYGDDVKETALEQVMTEKQYAGYQEALDAGISTYYYCTFITEAAGLEADKDANGKTISGSKKEKVMEAIDELPLTKDQKDILYYQQGYSKSEIGKAPWR